MEVQKPATGVMAMHQYPDAKFFRVPCECGCEAEINFNVEVDDCNVTSHLYVKTKTNYWRERLNITYEENWLLYAIKSNINDWYNRIVIAWTALTKGYVETEAYVLLNEQQTLNFAAVLNESVIELRKKREERKV